MKIEVITYPSDQVRVNGVLLTPDASLKVRNHSPTGFNWGYAGSGPAQLALAILLLEFDRDRAQRLYQRFKAEFIAKQPEGEPWTLEIDLPAWAAAKEAAAEGRVQA